MTRGAAPPDAVPNRPKAGLLRSAGVYGLSNILERASPVLLLPLLTYYLSPADMGMISLFTAAVGMVALFVGVNISYAVRRRYFDANRADFPAYVANCLGILLAGTAVLFALIALLPGPLSRASGLPVIWLAAAVMVAALQEFLNVPLTIWQVENQPERYGRMQVARSTAMALVTALFVITFHFGWQGAATATLATNAAFALAIGVPALRPWVKIRFDRAHVAHALSYGGGLIPHTLGTVVMRTADRFVIGYYAGTSENGLYWVGYQVGLVVLLASESWNRAWSPWLYAALAEHDADTDRRIVRLTYRYFTGIAALAAAVALVGPVVVRWALPPEFHESGRFIAWIALGFAFNGMYTVISAFVFYSERTLVISWITGVSAVLNLALDFVLIPRFGAIGAAQAGALAFLLRFVLTWIAAERLRPMPWRL